MTRIRNPGDQETRKETEREEKEEGRRTDGARRDSEEGG